MGNQTVRELISELRGEIGELIGEREKAPSETCDADWFAESGVGAPERKIGESKRATRVRAHFKSLPVEVGDEAAVAVGVVESRAVEFIAIGGFDHVQRTPGDGAEV